MTAPNSSSVRTKRCRACNVEVDVALFARKTQHRDGLDSYCRPCRTRLERRRRKMRTMGRTPWRDASRARAHVQQLLDAGLTRHQIAEHTGINRTVIRNLMVGQPHASQGPAKRLRWDTEAALLSVNVTACVPVPVQPGRSRRAGALVDPTGTIRRLQALMANGWPARELATRLGTHTPSLQIRPDRKCTSSTAHAVRTLYAQLADLPGPSPRTAAFYRGRGYLPPGWWDDDTIDDPGAEPDGVVTSIDLSEHGGPRRVQINYAAPRAQQVRRLARHGLTPRVIADVLGVKAARVRVDLGRTG